MTQLIEAPGTRAVAPSCDPATRVTRSLLGYGVLAGPLYVSVSLLQAAFRDGFDLRRHAWSLLSNGYFGWIQVANFALTGLMTVAFGAGVRRTGLSPRAPWLIGGYGLCLVAAGVFRADPALGFPPGTPAGPAQVSWHGMVHFGSGALGFGCLIAACLAVGRRFAVAGNRGWAAFSRTTAVLFLAGFAGVASGSHAAWTNLAFVVTMVLTWAWVCALAVHLYRTTAR
jgi:hypothetical protein